MELDQTHRRILALLQQDARMTATAIGKTVGLSRPAVQDRITAMENAGVIKGYHAQIDETASLVRGIVFVTIAQRPCDKALSWLETLEGVSAVFSLSGEVDAIVHVSVPDVAELSKMTDRILASPLIATARTSVVLYPRA